MGTIFISLGNGKTSELHRLVLKRTTKIDLQRSDKNVT